MHMCFDKQVSFYEFIPQTHTFSDTGKKQMLFSSPGVLKQVWVTQGGKSQVMFGILSV